MAFLYSNLPVVSLLYLVLSLFALIIFGACLSDKFWLGDNSYKYFVRWVAFTVIMILLRLELSIVSDITENVLLINIIAMMTYIAVILLMNSSASWLLEQIESISPNLEKHKHIFNILAVIVITTVVLVFATANKSYTEFMSTELPPMLKLIHIELTVFSFLLLAIFVYYRRDIPKPDIIYFALTIAFPSVLIYHIKTFGLPFSAINLIVLVTNYFRVWQKKKVDMLSTEKNLAEQTSELSENQIDAVLARIKPRLIYDTLDAIAENCEKNPDLAYNTTVNFSSYLRYNLAALKSNRPVMLSEELKQVKTYIEIEKVKSRGAFSVSYDIDADFEIPSMALQILVENAFKHIDGKRGPADISIDARKTDEGCFLSVEDNGSYYNTREEEGSILKSVSEKLKIRYGGNIYFEHKSDSFGTAARVFIPNKNAKTEY